MIGTICIAGLLGIGVQAQESGFPHQGAVRGVWWSASIYDDASLTDDWLVPVTPEQPRSPPVVAAPAPLDIKTPPTVPDDAKSLYAQLQVRGAGIADVMALLQKEIDSVNAERARLVQRLIAAQPDFDLAPAGPLSVAYVLKKAEPKK
jgi:hypothetical protein